ncbi:MAG TPA: hypothetical protein VL961_05725, partial [Acidimicrobiales bacterium]|nr:hypothetical protein [Acidimicrobiales bacterium]
MPRRRYIERAGTLLAISAVIGSGVSLAVSMAPGATGLLPSAGAAVAGQGTDFDCTGDVIYNVSTTAADSGSTQAINAVVPGTGAVTQIATIPTTGGSAVGEPNALGITKGGTAAYFVDEQHSGNLYEYNALTQAISEFSDTNSPGTVVAGAVDPANGIYYYASYANSTATIYGFNTATNTAITGVVATAPLAVSGTSGFNGDLAFDALGNLYLVDSVGTSGGIAVVKGPLPTTAADKSFTSTTITTSLSGATTNTGFNGIGFLADGDLVVERLTSTANQSALYVLDPNDGATVSGPTNESGADVDLGACSYNPTLTLTTDVGGRIATTDQFTTTASGGDLSSSQSATTTGTATGVQAAEVGPLIGVSGQNYTITLTASGTTNLSDYDTSYSCVDTNTDTTVSSGTGTTFSLPFPSPGSSGSPDLDCSFDETPLAAAPQLTLGAALSGARLSDTDQFTVAVHTGSASGPVVSSTADSTTTGTGSTVTAGTGTTGTYTATSGTTYYLTEAAAGTTDLSQYAATIGCTDANDVQPGLPSVADFGGSFSLTPVGGADISCTVTNSAAPQAGISIDNAAIPAAVSEVGDTITHTYTVDNTGNVTLNSVSVEDTQSAPAGPLTAGPDCTGLTNPTDTCSGNSITLAPGQSATFSATYTVTQPDLDAGSVNDSATATGTPTGSTTPIVSDPSGATVPVTQNPDLALTTTVGPSSFSTVGQALTDTFTVENTGNVTLSSVGVDNTQSAPAGPLTTGPTCTGLTSPVDTCSGNAVTLAPGQSATFSATYMVTQADLDAGSVNNSAVADGFAPGSTTPTDSDSSAATVPAEQTATITMTKAAAETSVKAVGDVIHYSYTVQNTGNVTLSSITVNDDLPGLSAVTCPDPVLAPSDSETCTATYDVTQVDLDAGSVVNTATASGTAPGAPGPVTSDPSTVTVPVDQTPTLALSNNA